jgi:hypothetical protein
LELFYQRGCNLEPADRIIKPSRSGQTKTEKYIIALLGLALILRIVSGYRNTGFWQPDEYFQIIEFAYFKLGMLQEHLLMWEYPAVIRPWLQPAVAFGVASIWPGEMPPALMLMRCLQIIMAITSTIVFDIYIRQTLSQPSVSGKLSPGNISLARIGLQFFFLSNLLLIRFSSEILSTLFIMGGLSLLFKPSESSLRFLMSGLLFGLAFHTRYQTGFACLGAFACLVFDGWRSNAFKTNIKLQFKLLGLFCAGVLIGILLILPVDFWGYNKVAFAPWEYLRVNLLEGKASTFGVHPWYDYMPQFVDILPHPWGIFIIILGLVAGLRNWRHPVIWATVFFVVPHFLIGHKEARFLFPAVFLMLPLMFKEVTEFAQVVINKFGRGVVMALVLPLIVINLLFLVQINLVPIDSSVNIVDAIARSLPKAQDSESKQTLRYYASGIDGTLAHGRLPMRALIGGRTELQKLSIDDLKTIIPDFVVLDDSRIEPAVQQFIDKCRILYESPNKGISKSLSPLGNKWLMYYPHHLYRIAYKCS